MKISDLMLTDEHRQELESCRTVGGYEGACDATDTVCRECLNRERAAIANAVDKLAGAMLLPEFATEWKALLSEARGDE